MELTHLRSTFTAIVPKTTNATIANDFYQCIKTSSASEHPRNTEACIHQISFLKFVYGRKRIEQMIEPLDTKSKILDCNQHTGHRIRKNIFGLSSWTL